MVGEILADLALGSLTSEPRQITARPGGSPANVAVGLARLDVPTSFAGRLSTRGGGPGCVSIS